MRCVFTILVQIRCIKQCYVHVIILLELTLVTSFIVLMQYDEKANIL